MTASLFKNAASASKRLLTNKKHWLSFLLGLVLVFAYAPYGQYWLMFIALPLWFKLLDKTTAKTAAGIGFFFAFGWFASGISWVHVSIELFGGMPLVVSLLLMLLLCLYLAIYPALACYLAARLSKNRQLNLLLLPATWTLAEYLRNTLLTGFPWLSLGYSQIDSPLRFIAPIFGEVGITFFILVISIALYYLVWPSKKIVQVRACLTLFVAGLALVLLPRVQWLTPSGESLKTALVQGNIEQELKWQPEQEWPTLVKYLNLTKQHLNSDIIVWPESAIPALEPRVQDFLTTLDELAYQNDSAIITGVLNYNYQRKQYFNGLVTVGQTNTKAQLSSQNTELTNRQNQVGSYSYNHDNRFYKYHLLPIGEFVPFEDWLRPLAPFFNLPMSSFSRGDYVQNNLLAKGQHVLPLICFEIAFPEQLAANFTEQTSVLLTVSNDAWFADSHGPHQHMEIARMRALEFGRPLLRSTNTGITASVDAYGQFIDRLPQFEQGVLVSHIELVTGNTPFSRWQKYPVFILSLLLFISIVVIERKAPKHTS